MQPERIRFRRSSRGKRRITRIYATKQAARATAPCWLSAGSAATQLDLRIALPAGDRPPGRRNETEGIPDHYQLADRTKALEYLHCGWSFATGEGSLIKDTQTKGRQKPAQINSNSPSGYLPNTACTEVSFVTVTLQVKAVPLQAPDQFTNALPAGGVAVSVTTVPSVNFAEQLPPQEIARSLPLTSLVTVPLLLRPIESVNCFRKLTPTSTLPLTLTEQVNCVPVHAPLQPPKIEPLG